MTKESVTKLAGSFAKIAIEKRAAAYIDAITQMLYRYAPKIAERWANLNPDVQNAILGGLGGGAVTGIGSLATGGSPVKDSVLGSILGALLGGGGSMAARAFGPGMGLSPRYTPGSSQMVGPPAPGKSEMPYTYGPSPFPSKQLSPDRVEQINTAANPSFPYAVTTAGVGVGGAAGTYVARNQARGAQAAEAFRGLLTPENLKGSSVEAARKAFAEAPSETTFAQLREALTRAKVSNRYAELGGFNKSRLHNFSGYRGKFESQINELVAKNLRNDVETFTRPGLKDYFADGSRDLRPSFSKTLGEAGSAVGKSGLGKGFKGLIGGMRGGSPRLRVLLGLGTLGAVGGGWLANKLSGGAVGRSISDTASSLLDSIRGK